MLGTLFIYRRHSVTPNPDRMIICNEVSLYVEVLFQKVIMQKKRDGT